MIHHEIDFRLGVLPKVRGFWNDSSYEFMIIFTKLPSDREKRDHSKIPETLSHRLSQLQYRKDLKTRFRCRPDMGE